ncbi:MAG: TIGR00269 family protein [Candidatus Micrarchaeia archaeon]|jgi:uncharacterized protein (TIGR00269 family)
MSFVHCTKCGKRAVADVEYAATSLCAKHFNEFFESKVRKANKEFSVLRRGDKIAVAVSGGKDSAAMLYSLNALARKIGAVELAPLLIDEGIAGYRNEAIKKAEKLCDQLGLHLTIVSFKEKYGKTLDEIIAARNHKWKDEGKRTKACSYCGVLRKRSLNDAALEMGANKLAVGHNADDLAQTFLMNLMRGEPMRVARFTLDEDACEEEFVPRVRPLAYCLERENALYCMLNSIPFHLDECPYAAEAFRGIAKDFFNNAEAQYPGVKLNFVRSFLKVSKTLKQESLPKVRKCVECGAPSSKKTCKACELIAGLN